MANKKNQNHDQLKIEGIYCQGYGIVAKAVMRDRRISRGAKALYAYICSYAGAGTTAYPGRDTICADLDINKDTYTEDLKELKAAGYIKTKKYYKDGKIKGTIFTLMLNPEPDTTIKLTRKAAIKNLRPKFSDVEETQENQGVELCPKTSDKALRPKNLCPKISDTNINSNNINSKEEEEEDTHTREEKKSAEELHYEEYEVAAMFYYQLFDNVFNDETHKMMLPWIDHLVAEHGKENVIYALARLAEQDQVDNVIRWMQKAIEKRNDYPPKIAFKNPNSRKKNVGKTKVTHKEKVYDSVLMG